MNPLQWVPETLFFVATLFSYYSVLTTLQCAVHAGRSKDEVAGKAGLHGRRSTFRLFRTLGSGQRCVAVAKDPQPQHCFQEVSSCTRLANGWKRKSSEAVFFVALRRRLRR